MTGDGSIQTGGSSRVTRHAARVTAVLLSCVALIIVFWGLLQLDLPLARFLRSVHVAWLERAGDVGNRLGSGAVLVTISGVMLAAGWLLKRAAVYRAGFEGLLAHGAAALMAQVLKHLIGRPRPRMMHNGGFQFGPSFETGLDSFPSGHVTASFAVATVIAKHFPGLAWPLYGAASLVAVSRIVRGSHFPTDAAAGLVLGVLAGALVANPLRQWRESLTQGLTSLTPWLVLVFALLWTASHPSPEEDMNRLMLAAGVVAIGIGLACRLARRFWAKPECLDLRAANALLGLGLALTTGSVLVTGLVLLVAIAWRLTSSRSCSQSDPGPDPSDSGKPGFQAPMQAFLAESVTMALLAAAVVVIQALKGLLPLL